MTDRDLQIGGLLAQVESLRNQNADQFRRIDVLEQDVARQGERIESLRERVEAADGAAPVDRSLPDLAYSWRFWLALVALLGAAFGAWSLEDIRTLIVGV